MSAATCSAKVIHGAGGEAEIVVILGATGGTSTDAAEIPRIAEFRFNKDLYDTLSSSSKTEFASATIANIISAIAAAIVADAADYDADITA